MDDNYRYLGNAIKWPIELNQLGSVSMQSGTPLIAQSIIRYLETPMGTEFFNEDTGSRISLIGYEPSDDLLIVLLEMLITEAVANEKRCEYIKTEFSGQADRPDIVQCRVYVRELSSKEIQSFIWPYYRENQQFA